MAQVAAILQLKQERPVVQERVLQILNRYYAQPILRGKNILKLNRGDEGIPHPLEIYERSGFFKLYAAIDGIFVEPNNTLHILDLKTGKSDFDLRQGYVYLLFARYLYPRQKAIASFYNLESCQWSEPIRATELQLNAVQANLARIAQTHDREPQLYLRQSPSEPVVPTPVGGLEKFNHQPSRTIRPIYKWLHSCGNRTTRSNYYLYLPVKVVIPS